MACHNLLASLLLLAAQAQRFPAGDGSCYYASSGPGPEHEGPQTVAQPARQEPDASSRLIDWLTLPGQVVGYNYNGHDIGDQAEIKVGLITTTAL